MKAKNYSTPIVIHFDYDMSRPWYVYFRFTNPIDGSVIQKKVMKDFNRIEGRSDRIKAFKALRDATEIMLADGWNPIEIPDFTERKNKPLYSSKEGYAQMKI